MNVFNEWDNLEEVIVGRATNFVFPENDASMDVMFGNVLKKIHGKDGLDRSALEHDNRLVDETDEDLEILCEALRSEGVIVRRPDSSVYKSPISTPFFTADNYYPYCPRDVLLTYGDMILETPNVFRSRYHETFRYKDLLIEYFSSGSKWISAPKPSLRDEHYETPDGQSLAITNDEPMFDAANILRANDELIYLISDSGNEMGLRWLQTLVGPDVKVHGVSGFYSSLHIDSSIALLGPKLALVNSSRITPDTIPEPLKDWEILFCPEMNAYSYSEATPLSSVWLGMNLLMVRPSLAIVDAHQTPLIEVLNDRGIDVIPLKLRHGRHLGGGFHCVTLDIRRRAY